MSLAPHWTAVATLFWLAAGGFLGALSLQAGLNQAQQDTALQAAQDWIMSWALLAHLCAYLNSVATELRGGNRRVTGYAPLWLIAFGAGIVDDRSRLPRRGGDLPARQFCPGPRHRAANDRATDASLAHLLAGCCDWHRYLRAGLLGAATQDSSRVGLAGSAISTANNMRRLSHES